MSSSLSVPICLFSIAIEKIPTAKSEKLGTHPTGRARHADTRASRAPESLEILPAPLLTAKGCPRRSEHVSKRRSRCTLSSAAAEGARAFVALAMAQKRRLDDGFDAEPTLEPAAKKTAAEMPLLSDFDMLLQIPRYGTSPPPQNSQDDIPRVRTSESRRKWRTLFTREVPFSLPLSNLVSTVQELIDPEFDPLIPIVDDEPRYLKPLSSRIAREDLEFLRQKGALTIPESELRDELLRCYVQWVHNFMPMLDLRQFLRCIVENDPSGNISLLLFQAVMFAGTAFVDLKHLQAAGYPTRKSARKAFFNRVKVREDNPDPG